MFFVYMVECRDGSLYTGWTDDLTKRLEKHNLGLGAKYTRARLPVKLVYAEELMSRGEALSRELKIKALTRKEKLKLVSDYRNNSFAQKETH